MGIYGMKKHIEIIYIKQGRNTAGHYSLDMYCTFRFKISNNMLPKARFHFIY
jgi:hypothetical protein